MSSILALRPFIPAKDFDLSKQFCRALGFSLTFDNGNIAIFGAGGFSFILRNFYVKDLAENFPVQLQVDDVDAWWARVDASVLARDFAVRAPRPPAVQPWGLKVGYLFDPSGVLWHVAEARA